MNRRDELCIPALNVWNVPVHPLLLGDLYNRLPDDLQNVGKGSRHLLEGRSVMRSSRCGRTHKTLNRFAYPNIRQRQHLWWHQPCQRGQDTPQDQSGRTQWAYLVDEDRQWRKEMIPVYKACRSFGIRPNTLEVGANDHHLLRNLSA